MAEKVTRLAYIMSRLGIRAEEVSKRTGVDKTLISRWKNGQRKLSPVSEYSKQISNFLLSLDNAEMIVRKTLNAYGLDENSGSLQDNFIFWLAEQESPGLFLHNVAPAANSCEYTASFRVFLGTEGLRSAILTMIDYVMSLSAPQNIVAVGLSDFEWVKADPSFIEQLVERLGIAFERGITLTLISRENFSDYMFDFSAKWLSAHLQGYIKSYYYKEQADLGRERVFLAVKDGICLSLEHDDEVADGVYAAMYTDNITVSRVYHNCSNYLSNATMLFRYGFFNQPGDFLKKINSESLLASDCYVCAALPTLGTIPFRQAHLFAKETLSASKQRNEQVKPLFTTPNQFSPAAAVRHIYCLESIERLLAPGRVVDYPLSAIYDKRIHHSRKQALGQLEQIYGWLQEHDNYEVALLPARLFEHIPLEFMCVRDNLCAAWVKDATSSTCVKEKNKVDSLFGYAEHLWGKLPKYCKERSRTMRQLNQWLKRD